MYESLYKIYRKYPEKRDEIYRQRFNAYTTRHFAFLIREHNRRKAYPAFFCYTEELSLLFEDIYSKHERLLQVINTVPPELTQMIDLEGKLQLEYYKLQKTFEGTITMKEETGSYSPAKAKGAEKPEDEKPLDEIIRKINEQYKGKFTEADKVLLTTLRAKLMNNTKLQTIAKNSNPQVFTESIFPKVFGKTAQDSYIELQDTFTTLFEDQAKYNVIMQVLSNIIYREMQIMH